MTDPDPRLLNPHLFDRIQQAPNLTSGLVSALLAQIQSGELQPGQRLPTEHAIVEATGVSRTVVREALASLRAKGLITTRQGLGAFVADSRVLVAGEAGANAAQILELRLALEPEAAALAALRRSDVELRRMGEAIGSEAAGAGEEERWKADEAFHRLILTATRNPSFLAAVATLGSLIQTPANSSRAATRGLGARHREHRAILEALASGDATAARRAMRRHLQQAVARHRA